MIEVRIAVAADVPELVRLRGVMLGGAEAGAWQDAAAATMRDRMAGGSMAAFVADREGGGLAACAAGLVEQRFADPGNPSGEAGYILNVATDPDQRRRGLSRACMTALIAWYADRGVTRIGLAATPEGEPLYRQLGFRPSTGHAALGLSLRS
ncbi:GNAT family N-acetyltransferase [Longispora albida]|uniref:GNAT family N-acetyltransferase n=1 Tax=Longispora albida TaxID=203523 RepID=UPI0003776D11|nr:GNAT family N-acetyltransferase [Longispora albida]